MLRSYILSSALLEVTGFWEEKDLEDVEGRSLDLVGGGTTNNSKVDVKNALKSDNIQNHLIVNCFLLFEERLLLL